MIKYYKAPSGRVIYIYPILSKVTITSYDITGIGLHLFPTFWLAKLSLKFYLKKKNKTLKSLLNHQFKTTVTIKRKLLIQY